MFDFRSSDLWVRWKFSETSVSGMSLAVGPLALSLYQEPAGGIWYYTHLWFDGDGAYHERTCSGNYDGLAGQGWCEGGGDRLSEEQLNALASSHIVFSVEQTDLGSERPMVLLDEVRTTATVVPEGAPVESYDFENRFLPSRFESSTFCHWELGPGREGGLSARMPCWLEIPFRIDVSGAKSVDFWMRMKCNDEESAVSLSLEGRDGKRLLEGVDKMSLSCRAPDCWFHVHLPVWDLGGDEHLVWRQPNVRGFPIPGVDLSIDDFVLSQ